MHAERERQMAETVAPMTEAPHRCTFPCQPPAGSLLKPGPCECGKSFERNKAENMLTSALKWMEATTPGGADVFRISTQWAVAWGARDGLNDGIGCVETYDDEQDAREHVMLYEPGASVVSRTVISCPWVTGDGAS
jgi:hypothetical protein